MRIATSTVDVYVDVGLTLAAGVGLLRAGARVALGTGGKARAQPAADATDAGVSNVLATPEVVNAKLQNIVNDLYKGTINPNRVGTGTTADAVRSERETGLPTGGTFHFVKATQYSVALSKLLTNGDLNWYDQVVAQSLLNDLQDALGNGP